MRHEVSSNNGAWIAGSREKAKTQLILMKDLLYRISVFFTRIIASFLHEKRIYTSRMHRLDELDPLVSSELKDEASLLIGITNFNHILRVQTTPKRRELRNALVIAPTRGGKGLLAIP